jgi:soluble lytic murein transglycosylase-like protein/predicted Zn-dependent peptidase
MAKLSASRRRALLGVATAAILLGAIVAATRSPRVRAAYVAFRDPARVHDDSAPAFDGAPVPAPMELSMPEPAGDFERASEDALADAGDATLATLMLPDFPIPISRRTMRFVGYFAARDKGRQAFAERFRRAGRYRPYIEQALRDAELPEDLVWLVAIESGFNPQAASPKGAAGLFQFMPETGDRYGLARSELVDERLSITRGTRAGVAHLHDLFEHYHQWDLALAAYNFGVEKLDDALARLAERRGPRGAGKPVELKDLVEAHLVPGETASFVPQVQAFAIVAANRGRFGLDDLDPVPPFELGEVAVPGGTPLRLVSRAAGISIAVLREYNPELLRDQVPPGGDAIVNLPADRVATTLAAFPALLAREATRLAAASASAASASAGAPEPAPSASATASASAAPKPVEPPPDRWTSASGVVIERRASAAADVTIAARVEILDAGRGAPRPSGRVFEVAPAAVRPADLGAGMDRAARAVRALAVDAGQAAVEARRRAGAARRRALEKTPYGSSWLALGDRFFGPGHPLAGTVLLAPTLPPQSVVIAEQPRRGGLAVTVTLTGAVDRAAAGALADRAFADVFAPGAAVAAHPREERIALTEPLPNARVIFGWLAPATGDEGAGVRLALISLAHHELGRAARALVVERHVAVHVRGTLDLDERAGVAAIEAVPAVLYDVAAVEQELDKAIEGFAERGPSAAELEGAKAQLRSRLQAERARAGTGDEPKEAALARIQRVSDRVEAITGDQLQALVKRVFAPAHRIVVTTTPRGG